MNTEQFHKECEDLFESRKFQREHPIAARFDLHHKRLERLMKSENRTIRIAAEDLATVYAPISEICR
jgi:hypothetical protein